MQIQDRHALRVAGDRNALWFFLIALVAAMSIAIQNYYFAMAASQLTFKLRTLGFRTILRQDSGYISFAALGTVLKLRSRVL